MNFGNKDLNKRLEWFIAGAVFLISLIAYLRTIAPTTSFWDCGEFIACSYTLSVMHPPGAPLYLLIGRVMTQLPLVGDIGLRINFFSAFIGAGTILFLFLIIAQLIRRWRGTPRTWEDRLIIFGSAAFGALAFAFTDSHWFNSVEAEVYALSMFFTAAVVWLAFYWGEHSKEKGGMLLIFFIFYLFGLATGVHLLNILAFPVVLLVAIFHENLQVKRLLLLLTIQAAVPMLLYVLFYQYDPGTMDYRQLIAHQAKAGQFLKIFGGLWVLGTLAWMYRKDKSVFAAWWVIPILMAIAYSTYLIIYIRANMSPPINENNPSTWQGMQDYLARKQYGEEELLLTFMKRKASFWGYQIHFMFTRYFGWNFIGKGVMLDNHDRIIDVISFRGLYGLPFIVGLWGAVHHFYKDWKRALIVFILFVITGYAIIIYLNQKNPQPRERDYSYEGAFFAFAIWVGIGMAGVLEWLTEGLKKKGDLFKKIVYGAAMAVLFIAVPLNLFAVNFESHDRSGNYVAWDYSYNILETCEKDGIIFTNGDNDTFPLWYLQEVEGIRKDVRVVNLSLLNTHWYIKQLKNEEPRVPMGLSEKQIESLQPIMWETQQMRVPVSESIRNSLEPTLSEKEIPTLKEDIIWELKPTWNVGKASLLKVQDLMVLRILLANQWKRPVYFAVTVARNGMLGMDEHLRMDGLAYRIMPYKPDTINEEVLAANVLDKYQYRGFKDPDVYFNTNTIKLLQNYRSAFQQLTHHYLQTDQKDKARAAIEAMEDRIPEENIPFASQYGALIISELYKRMGEDSGFDKRSQNLVEGVQVSREDKYSAAYFHINYLHEYEKGAKILEELHRDNPGEIKILGDLIMAYRQMKDYDKAILLLEEHIMRNPRDTGAVQQLQILKQMADKDSISSD
ncbi:DUF2723 domain-containing protein [bacterium]|nr:DUF2723 domain-containing protein [bacterium]